MVPMGEEGRFQQEIKSVVITPIGQSERKRVAVDQREMPVFEKGVRKKGDLDSACKVRKSEMKEDASTPIAAWNPFNICGSTVT